MRNACAWLVLGCAVTLGSSTVEAQAPLKVVVSGLKAPGKMLALETGAILVSESGTGVHDSRVTAFDTDGNRLTLIEGLPSGLAFPNNDPSGASGLALRNHTLYIAISAGDSGIAGPVQGSEIPNPNKSSPIFSSVLALEFDRTLSGVTAPFRVTPAHHQALARRERVALVNERGERATLRLVVDIPDHVPEPRPDSPQNARASNPFALEPDGSCALWLVDASRNLIWKVDICENTFSTLTTFPPTTNPTPAGPPRIDAVPTSARTATCSSRSCPARRSCRAWRRSAWSSPPPASTRRSSPDCARSWTCCRSAERPTASSCWSSRAICWLGCRDVSSGSTRRQRRPSRSRMAWSRRSTWRSTPARAIC